MKPKSSRRKEDKVEQPKQETSNEKVFNRDSVRGCAGNRHGFIIQPERKSKSANSQDQLEPCDSRNDGRIKPRGGNPVGKDLE